MGLTGMTGGKSCINRFSFLMSVLSISLSNDLPLELPAIRRSNFLNDDLSPLSACLKHRTQSEMRDERVEVPVAMQQRVATCYASRRDHRIDGLTRCDAQGSELSVVFCGLNGNVLSAELNHDQRGQ